MSIVTEIFDLRTDRRVELALTEADVLRIADDLSVPDDKPLAMTLGVVNSPNTTIADVNSDMSHFLIFVGILPVESLSDHARLRLSIELSKAIALVRETLTNPAPTSQDDLTELYQKIRTSAYALDYSVF